MAPILMIFVDMYSSRGIAVTGLSNHFLHVQFKCRLLLLQSLISQLPIVLQLTHVQSHLLSGYRGKFTFCFQLRNQSQFSFFSILIGIPITAG